MEIIVNSNLKVTCCSAYNCGYVLGYHGHTYEGSPYTEEARRIKVYFQRNDPPAEHIDFFLGAINGERAAVQERDARIMQACRAKGQ